ncbi:hypothetical protein B0T24DRAFT_608201 [Lasiosphaeria ovina]|uniref:Adenosine deaminase domain-containing protein n=1 Tax=Lasiosphaeria ovina TaxID=92902 RepID=A0AAE0TYP5_9PEZI|nr:hypothetical protein B0T24DRAFT_608201 [Lasiosphaeria ovina]
MKRLFCWPFTDGDHDDHGSTSQPGSGSGTPQRKGSVASTGQPDNIRHYHHVPTLRNLANERSTVLKAQNQDERAYIKILEEIYESKKDIHIEYEKAEKAEKAEPDKTKVAQIQAALKDTIAPYEDKITRLMKRYHEYRNIEISREQALGSEQTSKQEYLTDTSAKNADEILKKARVLDLQIFANEEKYVDDKTGMEYPHYHGDHFVSNRKTIEKTRLFAMAEMFPKGSHLHIHFNSNLSPDFLLSLAAQQKQMYIGSNKPLGKDHRGYNAHNWKQCAIYFHIRYPNVSNCKANIFAADYRPGPTLFPSPETVKFWMPLWKFRQQFSAKYRACHPTLAKELESRAKAAYKEKYKDYIKRYKDDPKDKEVENPSDQLLDGLVADQWLREKLAVQDYDANHPHQNPKSAWEDFNIRTGFMKGLTNYVSGYREYCKAFMWSCVREGILYVEIRLNFMTTNQILSDNGRSKLSNLDTVELVIEAYNEFQSIHGFHVVQGLRIIYCTPRSFEATQIEESMDECIRWLENPFLNQFIAGFDLIGEEATEKHPLIYHVATLYWFKKKCHEKKVKCPLLLHCGETITIGEPSDLNLFDALVLGAKRIGHGYALAYHPWVMNRMQENKVGIELCPISNELLGLTPTIMGHAGYVLMANGLDCTVSTDNGTLFKSRLVHDLYQSMAGKRDMTLFGWVQLAKDSMAHSILHGKKHNDVAHDEELSPEQVVKHENEYKRLTATWETMFKEYLEWVQRYEYSISLPTTKVRDPEIHLEPPTHPEPPAHSGSQPHTGPPPAHPGSQSHTGPLQAHPEPDREENSSNDFHDILAERDANGSIIYELVELDDKGVPKIQDVNGPTITPFPAEGPAFEPWSKFATPIPADPNAADTEHTTTAPVAPQPKAADTEHRPQGKKVMYHASNQTGNVRVFALAIGRHAMDAAKMKVIQAHPEMVASNPKFAEKLHWRYRVKRKPMTAAEFKAAESKLTTLDEKYAAAAETLAKNKKLAAENENKTDLEEERKLQNNNIAGAIPKPAPWRRKEIIGEELTAFTEEWKRKAAAKELVEHIWKWGLGEDKPGSTPPGH